MKIKFVVKELISGGYYKEDSKAKLGEEISINCISSIEEATKHDTYDQAVSIINNINAFGIYQVDKIFIKG